MSIFGGKFVIWSFEHGAYWRSNSAGYCTNLLGAGLYDQSEAEEIARSANEFSDRKNEEARDAEKEWARHIGVVAPNTLGAALLKHLQVTTP